MEKKILVPFDGSESAKQAISFALSLAGSEDVIFFIYVQKPHYDGIDRLGNVSREDLDSYYEEEGKKVLAMAEEVVRDQNVEFEMMVRIGLPAIEITKAAKELSAHSIIMGSKGMSPIVNYALGSVTYSVIHLASCPVTIVPYT